MPVKHAKKYIFEALVAESHSLKFGFVQKLFRTFLWSSTKSAAGIRQVKIAYRHSHKYFINAKKYNKVSR